MAKKIEVDTGRCIGCGACAGMRPDVFALENTTEGARAHVLTQPVDENGIEEVINSCPVGAISRS